MVDWRTAGRCVPRLSPGGEGHDLGREAAAAALHHPPSPAPSLLTAERLRETASLQLLQYANDDALRVLHKKLVALSSGRGTSLARTQSVPTRIPEDGCGDGEPGSLRSMTNTETPMGGGSISSHGLQRTSSGTPIRRVSHGHSAPCRHTSSSGIAFGSAAAQRTVGGHDGNIPNTRASHRLSSSATLFPGSELVDCGTGATNSGDLDSAQKQRPATAVIGGKAKAGLLSAAGVTCATSGLLSSPAQLGLEDSACNPEEEPDPVLASVGFQACCEPATGWLGSLGGGAGSGASTPPAACSPTAGGAEGLARQGPSRQTSCAELEEQEGAACPPVRTDARMAADAAERAGFSGTQLAATTARLSSEELLEVGGWVGGWVGGASWLHTAS